MDKTKNTVRNIVYGLLNKAILMIGPFILRTLLIKKLGTEYLGLSSLFTSILQVLSLAELGFSSAIVYSMYKPIVNNDQKTLCALMNLYKKIYRIIGIVVLVAGLFIMPFIKNIINGSYPENINIYFLYLIYLFNTVITYFLFAFKTAVLTAYQRNDIISKINLTANLIQYILQGLILVFSKNYYLYVSVVTLTTIINNIWCSIQVDKMYPTLKAKGEVSVSEKKKIKKQVGGLMIQRLCATTRNSLDSIFISAFLGLNLVTIYGNYYMIMSSIISLIGILTNSMIAAIGNSIVIKSVEKNYEDMKKFNFIYMWISGWCTICLACLYQPFMELWMGKNYMLSYFAVVCFCIYFYSLKMGDILSVYTQASGIWWEGRYKAIIETICNIILNYVLGKLFGIYGIILATALSLLTIGFTYGTQIVFKNYFKGISSKEYYINHFKYAIVTVIVGTFTYFICSQITINNVANLLIDIIICLIVPNITYFLLYRNKKEFQEGKKIFTKIFRKEK